MAPSQRLASPTHETVEALRRRGVVAREIEPLEGDVSPRRYYRLRLAGGGSRILVTYPAELHQTCERFTRASSLLSNVGVRIPQIQHACCDEGFMVLEDLGPRTLYDLRHIGWDELAPYLQQAADLAAAIAAIPPASVRDLNAPLDGKLLSSELERTWDLLLGPDGVLPGASLGGLETALELMIERLAASEQRPAHRDFMARNLVPVGEPPGLAVIDHQDLRIGPATYDLASLLNDSLYPPPAIEEAILSGRLATSEARYDYHRAASQRTLKAVGTFVSFSRRGYPRHLRLVHPTLERARRHLLHLPEMRNLAKEIDDLIGRLLSAFADNTAGR